MWDISTSKNVVDSSFPAVKKSSLRCNGSIACHSDAANMSGRNYPVSGSFCEFRAEIVFVPYILRFAVLANATAIGYSRT